MLDPTRLEEALDFQQRSYQLLLWLSKALPRGFISFDTAHDYASCAESARAWIEEHFSNLPTDGRPTTLTESGLVRFSNVFASYLETSFDLVEEPGTRLDSRCGCYCPFCAVAVDAPYLRTKRLGPGDKRRAREHERDCVEELALTSGRSVTAEELDQLLQDRNNRENAAMIAYAIQLVRRCDGLPTGPYVLALWRTFAWTPTGSPKKEVRLDADAVLRAEGFLIRMLESN